MTTKKYYLYLDEMLENLSNDVDYFSLAGFIIEEDERNLLDAKISKLKSTHNIPGVIHWTDMRRNKDIWLNKSEEETKNFLIEFTQIIEESDLTVLASLYNARLITDNIKSKKWLSHRHIYSMKKIFENFFIFLNKQNAIHENVEGHVIVESSTIDEELKKLFHSVMIFGTDFVSQQGLTKFIKGIEFIQKSENNNLLQVADPMPSEIHRYIKSNNSFNRRLLSFKTEMQKLRQVFQDKSFDGYTNRKDLFGIHVLE